MIRKSKRNNCKLRRTNNTACRTTHQGTKTHLASHFPMLFGSRSVSKHESQQTTWYMIGQRQCYEKSTRLTWAGEAHLRDTASCSRSVQCHQNTCRVVSSDAIILVLAWERVNKYVRLMLRRYLDFVYLSSLSAYESVTYYRCERNGRFESTSGPHLLKIRCPLPPRRHLSIVLFKRKNT